MFSRVNIVTSSVIVELFPTLNSKPYKNRRMKTNIILLSLLLFFKLSTAQDVTYEFGEIYTYFQQNRAPKKVELRYMVRGVHARSIVRETLNKAQVMSDIYAGYPTSWVKDYVSIEMSATCNGKVVKAQGKTHLLNEKQKRLLKMADLNTDIEVNVKYKHSNAATHLVEVNNLDFKITVIPQVEATYIGGYEKLINYLKKEVMDEVSKMNINPLSQGTVRFTISTTGKAVGVRLHTSLGNSKIDKMLLETIRKMPKWQSAKNAKGKSVEQYFELIVGDLFGGC